MSDEQKRAAYDQYGAAGANGGFGGGAGGFGGFDGAGFGGFEDIFSSFFGGGASRNPNAPRQGMTSNTASISSLKKRFLVRKRSQGTIGKLAVIPVMVLGLSQGLVR